MRIRHERPEDGLSFLVTAPLTFFPDDGALELKISTWSLEGVRLDDTAAQVAGPGILRLPFQGVMMDLPVCLKPRDEDGLHGFDQITVRQRELLACLYQGLLSGKMTSTADMIQSLDTPVDLVPMEETETEKTLARTRVAPRLIRALRTALIYGLGAGILLGGVGNKVWQRLDQLSPRDAHVTAPLVDHYFHGSGQVDRILITPGQSIAVGETLVEIQNADLDRQVDAVRTQIRLYEDQLAQAEAARAAHQRQMAARRTQLVAAFKAQPSGRAAKGAAFQALRAFDLGISAVDSDLQALATLLESREQELRDTLRFARRELGDLKEGEQAAHLRAKVVGIVSAVHVVPGLSLGRQHLGVTLEENRPRSLVGFLPDRQADQVHVGMPARVAVRIDAERRVFKAHVTDFQVVPLGKAVDQAVVQAYALQVSVTLEGLDTVQTRTLLRPGAPAKITLYRQTRQRLVSNLFAWMRG